MATKKKGLGRGLDILIPQESKTENKAPKRSESKKDAEVKKEENKVETLVSINEIEPNVNQPRKQFDEDSLDELAESIKQYGLLQPLVVQKKDKFYQIIAGERRWRACKKAGLKKVPVIVKEFTDKDILSISLIENLQREDLNPIEEAKAYKILSDEYNMKQDEIATSVSKSRTVITNTMRLLKLDEKVQELVIEGVISSGHGRTLLGLENSELQLTAAEEIVDKGYSVREAEKLVKRLNDSLSKKDEEDEESKKQNEAELQMINFYENRMKEILGSKVSIQNKKNNKGKIEIEYYSKEELERIIDMIQSIK